MENNLHYFEQSLKQDDEIIDFTNPKGVMVISNNKLDEDTQLMVANHNLIENITAYKVIRDDLSESATETKKNILKKIIKIIEETPLINYSAFCTYFQVLKYSYSSYMSNKSTMKENEKIELIQKIVDEYINNRHDIYLSHGYSDQVLQVMSDIASSRRNGITGIQKIEKILEPKDFKHVKDSYEFNTYDYCYLLPDKGEKNIFNEFLKANNLSFVFHEKRDKKYPDMLLKINQDIFIIEHKLTNGEGGLQNAEINEIIEFIAETESNIKIHYVSCLQGNFIKNLSKNANKNKAQFDNIRKHLKKYERNYFVNGKGLEMLIEDFINCSSTNSKD